MRPFSIAKSFFRSLFRRQQMDAELDDEIRSTVDLLADQKIRDGMPPDTARRAARIEVGGVEQVKEAVRDARVSTWLDSFARDVRFGLRVLQKNPGFAAVAVLTLTLGIGANTAIFSVADAVLLNPVPFPHPNRLVDLYEKTNTTSRAGIPYPDLLDWQRDNHGFEGIAGYMGDEFTLTGSGKPARIPGERVSANFFSVLGVRPILGRTFRGTDDQVGVQPVALISEGLWKRAFASNTDVLGKTIALNGKAHVIVGVVPSGFRFFSRFDSGVPDAIFVPLGQWDVSRLRDRVVRMGLTAVGRLKPGVTVGQAQAEMNQIAANLARTYPNSNAKVGAVVIPMKQDVGGDLRSALLILLGAVGLVLLVACANLANLLLARSSGRAQEFAIRAALGASQKRLRRQLLVESTILALAGGTGGVLLANLGTRYVLSMFPTVLPSVVRVQTNLGVLGAALAASLLSVVLFGLAPALKISAVGLQSGLKESNGTTSSGHHRTQFAVVVTEISLSLVLLIAAGLLMRSFVRVWSTNPGFDPDDVLTMSVSISSANLSSPRKALASYRELRDRISSIPGVSAASLSLGSVPFSGSWSAYPLWRSGQTPPSALTQWRWAAAVAADPDYFRVLRIPLIRGREFTEEDGHSAPVVVIDQGLARQLFPNEDPVGRRLDLGPQATAEVVGLVRHVLPTGLDGDAASALGQMYFPYAAFPGAPTSTMLIIRSSVKPLSLVPAIQERVEALDPNAVVYDARTMKEMISGSLAGRRFSMALLGAFAGMALLLAAMGIYGVVSYFVTQRTHEIGIRMALGAQPGDIVRDVLSRGSRMALAGIALGLAASFGLTRLMKSMLVGVSATDPLTFIAVTGVLLVVALLACWIPARRAMKVDPMVAVRYE